MRNLSSSQKDLLIILILTVTLFTFSTIFDFFQIILNFISTHDSLQVDDLIVIGIFLVVAFIAFSYRRIGELKIEMHERRAAEIALLKANTKLNLLTSITRHDINNQLTVLTGFLDILEENEHDPSETEIILKANQAANRIGSMIQFTREYEKIGGTAPSWQEIHKLADIVVHEAHLSHINVENKIHDDLRVFADPLVIKVIYNLIDNAVRYGGKITTIRLSDTESANNHIIVCEDDGEGVVFEEKDKIFERGFGKNTGLGLALSREILNITNIDIHENGEPGKGARFEILVPKQNVKYDHNSLT